MLSGVVVSVLATGFKGCGFKPSRDDGFLRVIKVCSTPSFGWEVKLEVPCIKSTEYAKFSFLCPFLLLAADVSAGVTARGVW
jgi:hypothetical protein